MAYVLLIALAVALLVTHHVVLGALVFALALIPLIFVIMLTLLAAIGEVLAGK